MKNNLENIGFHEVQNQQGETYAEFRKKLTPDYKAVTKDLLKGYLSLLFILLVAIFLQRFGKFYFLFMLPSVFLLGYCLAYLHLFIHEAAHYNIHPDRKKNDWLSDLFIGVFFGIRVTNYRKTHWQHHQHLGTTGDSEHTYYHPLNLFFLLKSITGLHVLSVVAERKRITSENRNTRSTFKYIAYVILFHTSLLAILYITGGWKVICMWLVALLCVFPLLAALRQLLEHRDEHALEQTDFAKADHGKVTRLFGNSLLANSFGAAGFNRHLIHHWDPVISYTRLKDVEMFLSNAPTTSQYISESRTGYIKTFVSLFKIQ